MNNFSTLERKREEGYLSMSSWKKKRRARRSVRTFVTKGKRQTKRFPTNTRS